MSVFYFGTNLKMHQTPPQTRYYIRKIREELAEYGQNTNFQVWIAPPFTSLEAATEEAAGVPLLIGAQSIHWEEEGAYTGEVSAAMIKACGARFVMLGHVERRLMFGETDEQINRKVMAALRHDLGVMLCVGEPRIAFEARAGHDYVAYQLRLGLHNVSRPNNLWILYEPMWSVGESGIPAAPEYVSSMLNFIRQVLVLHFGLEGKRVPLLYGGSVDESNCADYAAIPASSGIGIGRSGLQPQKFLQIFQRAYQAWQSVPRETTL